MFRLQQLLTLALLPALFLGKTPVFTHEAVWVEFWNLGHIVMFFLLTRVAFEMALARRGKKSRVAMRVQLALIAAVIIAFGLFVEFVQLHIGRDFSWMDWVFDIGGCSIAISNYLPRRVPGQRVLLPAVILGLCLIPLSRELLLEWQLYRQLPVLLSGDSDIALRQIRADGAVRQVFPADDKAHGKGRLEVQFIPRKYSLLSLNRMVPDWSHWHSLHLDINNPGPGPLPFSCRVHDLQHMRTGWIDSDRFNHRYLLKPGMNRLRIPLDEIQHAPATREMDLKKVMNLSCFTKELSTPRMLEFFAIYLR